MSQNLQNFAKFQKFQLDNLVDFEKCCKTRIFLQKSVPMQPKTSNILPKFCQKLARRGLERSSGGAYLQGPVSTGGALPLNVFAALNNCLGWSIALGALGVRT